MSKIKEEIESFLISKFIRKTKYVQWLVNIVLVIKKMELLESAYILGM